MKRLMQICTPTALIVASLVGTVTLFANASAVPSDVTIEIQSPSQTSPSPSEPPVPPSAGDLCLNLPGVQDKVPEGMESANGNCSAVTTPTEPSPEPPSEPSPAPSPTPPPEPSPAPSPSPSPTPTPPTESGTSRPEHPPLPNVPDFLQPISRAIVNLIPENIQKFFRELPPETVDSIPLYVFIIILILVLVPLIQAIREYLYKRHLMALYKREKNIAEEKDNFIVLASHYVRTPIAIIRDSMPLLLNANVITKTQSESANAALGTLTDQLSSALEKANKNPALRDLPNPADVPKPKLFWRSGWFWLPIALSIVLTIIVNFLIGVVGQKQIGSGITWFQIIIIIAFIVICYLLVRNYYIQKHLREENKALVAREEAIDRIRNTFINDQAANISTALGTLFFSVSAIPAPPSYAIYQNGLSRLGSIHDKLILLSQIKTGASRAVAAFDLKSAIDRSISARQSDISAKNLSVQNFVNPAQITQNESLFSFVISSVLDNAIKFTSPNGHIVFSSKPSRKSIRITVSDDGQGIDPTKLGQLFKPFSRAESAVNFSYEGLGLSLFLNRLILTYAGGSISADPRPSGGANINIITPATQR